MKYLLTSIMAVAACASSVIFMTADAQTLGSVDTEWNMLGANHKLEVLAFDDPKVQGATCYLSRPITGGLTGGFSEQKSDVSIACRATGPLKIVIPFKSGEQAFDESRSMLFKKLRVVRMWDSGRQVLVYLAYSDKMVDGSPKNSISVIPFR